MPSDHTLEQGVLDIFYALCRIPHPSGHEEAVAQYLKAQLEAIGLSPQLDQAGNLICDVPGTQGLTARPRLALQAHMDMVCVGPADYHPQEDPIHTELRDGFLCTDGRSSLGADCGIGLSCAMYLVTSGAPHVPLRLLFTVDEERGLAGAQRMDKRCLSGCTGLINLDGFHFGQLMISSAGGCRQTFRRTPDCFFPMLDAPVAISITGLLGGHSGDNIGAGRANAAQLLLWLLGALEIPYELSGIDSGSAHNAIPASAQAVLVTDSRDKDKLQATIGQFLRDARALYPLEQSLSISVSPAQMPASVFTVDERDDLLALAGLVPCGVQEMHPLVPEVVGTSGNLGMIHCHSEKIEIYSFLRSCSNESMAVQRDFLTLSAQGFGYSTETDSYPAWPGVAQDPLSNLFLEEGKKLGIELRKNAVHVGLEPSIFHEMAPELPMISTGMDVLSPHSVQERVRLSTIAPFTRLLGACIQNWA